MMSLYQASSAVSSGGDELFPTDSAWERRATPACPFRAQQGRWSLEFGPIFEDFSIFELSFAPESVKRFACKTP
jgi:hypothetical protein